MFSFIKDRLWKNYLIYSFEKIRALISEIFYFFLFWTCVKNSLFYLKIPVFFYLSNNTAIDPLIGFLFFGRPSCRFLSRNNFNSFTNIKKEVGYISYAFKQLRIFCCFSKIKLRVHTISLARIYTRHPIHILTHKDHYCLIVERCYHQLMPDV